MSVRYLIRLDDACPTMDRDKWQRMFDILDCYSVRPMVGVIPHNEDPKQMIDRPSLKFWDEVKLWEQKGYAIALHGYNHCYISDKGMEGLNPLWPRSEFSGVPLEVQVQKIRDGYEIMKYNGVTPKYFFAPSHTFDTNTLSALKEYTCIRIISDTVATKPYREGDFVFIPQIGGHCMEMKVNGIWTFCLHPSAMTEISFQMVENFLRVHKDNFIGFDELDLQNTKGKDLLSRLFSWMYFTNRKLMRIVRKK